MTHYPRGVPKPGDMNREEFDRTLGESSMVAVINALYYAFADRLGLGADEGPDAPIFSSGCDAFFSRLEELGVEFDYSDDVKERLWRMRNRQWPK